jgi:SAM-dependent methyltransferase
MRSSGREHWDRFWLRDRELGEIYDNDDRIAVETGSVLDLEGALTLEVGAATARDSVSLEARGAAAVALDYSMAALRRAREAGGTMLVAGDAEALPFREESFDLVFHQGVMEHFADPDPMLSENVRVLRKGGTLLVDVPQTLHVYTLVKKLLIGLGAWFAGWETQYTPGSLRRLLRRHGLRPYACYGRFFAPSLAYRILRELLMRVGLRLPLRPVLVPPVHRLRRLLRRRLERSSLGPRIGVVVGVFARRPSGGGGRT